jgi:ribonucleoside-diphosphate reductase beta chain
VARTSGNGMERSLLRMAEVDPELAGRLLMHSLPAAAAPIQDRLEYRIVLEDVGAYQVSINSGSATVARVSGQDNGTVGDFELLTDAASFARLAAGASPLRLMLSRRLRVRGKRRRALKLRKLAGGLSMRDIARAGVEPDPDLLYQALPYVIDPEWTKGHRFCVEYALSADDGGSGGSWYLHVNDGHATVTTAAPEGGPDAVVSLSHSTWLAVVRGDMTPGEAMQRGLSRVDGMLPAVTVVGRWIERSEGRDGAELERETRQRAVQERRATWGSQVNGTGPGQGDPAHESERGRQKKGADLLSYEDLYALWERQNWRAHEIDFSEDKRQWLITPTESQFETIWSTASFYIGEERVAADLAPFVVAAPSGEVEIFLTTQLVDEARHAAFFDRFMAEVLALQGDDLRARLQEMEKLMLPPWHHVFDDELRGIARRVQASPDDLDLYVEGITTYHMVIEGVLAMTGQHFILKYMSEHGLYPGFVKGFSLVEQDEHRHIAFGVRFLRDVCEQEPRDRTLVREKIEQLVPDACHIFVPPYADDPSDFISYAYTSRDIYGYAYRALKRRMSVIGVDVPSADELMPGPIAEPVMAVAGADRSS